MGGNGIGVAADRPPCAHAEGRGHARLESAGDGGIGRRAAAERTRERLTVAINGRMEDHEPLQTKDEAAARAKAAKSQ